MSRKQLFKQQWDQNYEFEKLKKLQKNAKNYSNKDFIPCMFIKGRSKKIILHFHANGEDISLTQPLMERISTKTRANVICMEYPGYGIYKDTNTTTTNQKAKLILQDAEVVFRFITETCKVKLSDVIVSGRSIGSGPACHLAAKFKPACLFLISPIKSVKDAARMMYGRVADFFIEERFDNFSVAKNVECPTAIFHGINDNMVPYQHSIEMLINGFVKAQAHMFLRDGMEHNRIDYLNDIIKPMRYFMKLHQIHMRPTKKLIDDLLDQRLQKNFGYVDKKAIKTSKLLGIVNKSQYYNNFEGKFIPQLPECSQSGKYQNEIYQPGWLSNDQEVENMLASPMVSTTFGEESFDTANSKSFLTYQNVIIQQQQNQQRQEIIKNVAENVREISKQIQCIEMKNTNKHRGVSIDFQPIKSKQQTHQLSYVLDINDQTRLSKPPQIPDDSQRIDTNEEDVDDINTSLIINSMNLPNLLNQTKPVNGTTNADVFKMNNTRDNILQDISKISKAASGIMALDRMDPKETVSDSFNDTYMNIDEEHKRELEWDIFSKLKQQEMENSGRQYRNAANYLTKGTNVTKSQQQLSTVCDNRVPMDIANIDKQFKKEPSVGLDPLSPVPMIQRNALSEHSQSDGEANINDTIDDIAYMSQKEAQINKLQLDSIPRHNIIGTSPQFQRVQGNFGNTGGGSVPPLTEQQIKGIQTNGTNNSNLFSARNKQIRIKRSNLQDFFNIDQDFYNPPQEQIQTHRAIVDKHVKIFEDQELQNRIIQSARLNQQLLEQKFNTVQSMNKETVMRQTTMHYHQLQLKQKKMNKESMSLESLRIHQMEEKQNIRDAPQQMAMNLNMSIKKRNDDIEQENFTKDMIPKSTKVANKLSHCHSEIEKTQKLTFKNTKEYFTVTKTPHQDQQRSDEQQNAQTPINEVADFQLDFDTMNEIDGDEEAGDMSEQLKGKTAAQSHQASRISNKTLANQIKKTKLNQQRIIPPSVMPIHKTFKKKKLSDSDPSVKTGLATQRMTVASPRVLINTNQVQQKKDRSNSVKRMASTNHIQALGVMNNSINSEPSIENSMLQNPSYIVKNINDIPQIVPSRKKMDLKNDDIIQSNRGKQDVSNYFSNKQLIQSIQTLSPRNSARTLNTKYSQMAQNNSQQTSVHTMKQTPPSSIPSVSRGKKDSTNTSGNGIKTQPSGSTNQVRVSYRQSGMINTNPVAEKSRMKNAYLQNIKEQQKSNIQNTSAGRWTSRQGQEVKTHQSKIQTVKSDKGNTTNQLQKQKYEHNQKKASLLKYQQIQSDQMPQRQQKIISDTQVLSARHPNVSNELTFKKRSDKNSQQFDKQSNSGKTSQQRMFQSYKTGTVQNKNLSRSNRGFQHASQKSINSIQSIPALNEAAKKSTFNLTQAISIQGVCCKTIDRPKNSFSINLTSDNFRAIKKK